MLHSCCACFPLMLILTLCPFPTHAGSRPRAPFRHWHRFVRQRYPVCRALPCHLFCIPDVLCFNCSQYVLHRKGVAQPHSPYQYALQCSLRANLFGPGSVPAKSATSGRSELTAHCHLSPDGGAPRLSLLKGPSLPAMRRHRRSRSNSLGNSCNNRSSDAHLRCCFRPSSRLSLGSGPRRLHRQAVRSRLRCLQSRASCSRSSSRPAWRLAASSISSGAGAPAPGGRVQARQAGVAARAGRVGAKLSSGPSG